MARPRTETVDVKRSKILDAARDVLIKKGYQDFHMSDVAKQARIATGTLYLYFKGKLEIFTWVFIDLLDRLDARLSPPDRKLEGLSGLKEASTIVLSFMDEYQDFLFQFTGEHPALSDLHIKERLKKRYAEHLQLIAQILKSCIQTGVIRPVGLPMLSLYFSTLARMFMFEKILGNSKNPLNTRSSVLVDLFLNGVGRSKETEA